MSMYEFYLSFVGDTYLKLKTGRLWERPGGRVLWVFIQSTPF